MSQDGGEITRFLIAWSNGDQAALEYLIPAVESEVRRLAVAYFRREPSNHTLQPTALVNEVYLRLIGWQHGVSWQNRAHFLGVTAKVMRRVLVDYARRRKARPSEASLEISVAGPASDHPGRQIDLFELDLALDKLAQLDPLKARLVELRFFGGLNEQETAEALSLSLRTAQREWNLARAWLFRTLSGGAAGAR